MHNLKQEHNNGQHLSDEESFCWLHANDLASVNRLLAEKSKQDGIKYAVYKQDKNFGSASLLPPGGAGKSVVVHWRRPGQREQGGVPYVILATKTLDCQFGRDRNRAQKRKHRQIGGDGSSGAEGAINAAVDGHAFSRSSVTNASDGHAFSGSDATNAAAVDGHAFGVNDATISRSFGGGDRATNAVAGRLFGGSVSGGVGADGREFDNCSGGGESHPLVVATNTVGDHFNGGSGASFDAAGNGVGARGTAKQRLSIPNTKKMDCPAQVKIWELVSFPEFRLDGNSATCRLRTSTGNRLREKIKSGDVSGGEKEFVIRMPMPLHHSTHVVNCGKESAFGGNHVHSDRRLVDRVERLAADGMTNVNKIKSHLHDYARNELGMRLDNDSSCQIDRPLTSHRMFPTNAELRYQLTFAVLRQPTGSLDQGNLCEKAKQWQAEKGSKVYFRPCVAGGCSAVVGDTSSTPNNNNSALLFVHQTSWQRDLLAYYGGYLCLLLHVSRTNRYGLPLYLLMVKTNVDYQVVATIVLQNDSTPLVQEALQLLKEWNCDWRPAFFVCTQGEHDRQVKAIHAFFPGCSVYVSDHHRQREWDRWLSKPGNGVSQHKREILDQLTAIADACDQEEYHRQVQRLKASRFWTGASANFRLWFGRRWLNRCRRWVSAFRKQCHVIGVRTTTGVASADDRSTSAKHDEKDLGTTVGREHHSVVATDDTSVASLFAFDSLKQKPTKKCALTDMLCELINNVLPARYTSYLQSNVNSLTENHPHDPSVPHFLYNRPLHFVSLVMESLSQAKNEFRAEDITLLSEDSEGANNTRVSGNCEVISGESGRMTGSHVAEHHSGHGSHSMEHTGHELLDNKQGFGEVSTSELVHHDLDHHHHQLDVSNVDNHHHHLGVSSNLIFSVKNANASGGCDTVCFGDARRLPSCTCAAWRRTYAPCRHFGAAMCYAVDRGWERLSPLYRYLPHVTLDPSVVGKRDNHPPGDGEQQRALLRTLYDIWMPAPPLPQPPPPTTPSASLLGESASVAGDGHGGGGQQFHIAGGELAAGDSLLQNWSDNVPKSSVDVHGSGGQPMDTASAEDAHPPPPPVDAVAAACRNVLTDILQMTFGAVAALDDYRPCLESLHANLSLIAADFKHSVEQRASAIAAATATAAATAVEPLGAEVEQQTFATLTPLQPLLQLPPPPPQERRPRQLDSKLRFLD